MSVIENLYDKLLFRLDKVNDRKIVRQGIKLKFSDFNQTTVEQQSEVCDHQTFNDLLLKAFNRSNSRGIRLVGLTLGFGEPDTESNQPNQPNQLSLAL